MPFAFAASFLTAAPVSCKPTSFSRPTLHCIALRSFPTRTFITFGLLANTHATHITTNSIHFKRSTHYATFRFIQSSFTRQVCSPPAALVVLACAVGRAAGCHAFCILTCWPTHMQLHSTSPHKNKKTRQPLFGAAAPLKSRLHIPRGFPHSSHRTYFVRALCSHPTSCSRTHFSRLRRDSFALEARICERGHHTANTSEY